MKIIFRLRTIALLVVLLFVLHPKANASHYAAVDLYATYVGAGIDGCTGTTEYKYDITFDEYKACESGNSGLDLSVFISVSSASSGVNTSITINTPTIDTLDELCDSLKPYNSCRVPGNTQWKGYVRHRFVATYILPNAAPDWIFSWNSCCRNGAIANITAASIYVECGLNNVVKYNNSTPRFLVSPLPYLCTNQPATYLNGPFDPNGDSLYVTNQAPLDGTPTTPTGYTAPYTLADPVGSAGSNPYTVNPYTGTATFTPTTAGFFVVAFRCDEYDRKTGVQTGWTRRDAQISILSCTAPPPDVDTTFSTSTLTNSSYVKKAILVCPGSNMTYTASSTSPYPGSALYMEANNSNISGSTFTVTGKGTTSIKGVFSWTPQVTDLGEHPLIITSKDSTCTGGGFSIVLKNYVVVLIRVVNGLDAGKDLPICELNPSPRQLFVRGAEFVNTVQWQDISGGPAQNLSNANIVNPIASPSTTTEYVVTAPELVGGCKNKDTVKVYVDKQNTIDIFPTNNPFVQCRPDYLQLDALTEGKGPRNNIPCGPSILPIDKPIDSVTFFGSPVYGSAFAYDTLGKGTPILYNSVQTVKLQYLLSKQDMREYGIGSSTLRSMSFETAKLTNVATHKYNNFTISLKCTNKNALSKTTGFETGTIPVYVATAPTYFPDGWHKFDFGTPYDYDTTKNLIVEICYSASDVVVGCNNLTTAPPLIKFMPTTYVSGLELKPVDAVSSSVCSIINDPGIKENLSRPVLKFHYTDAPYLPFIYKWTPGNYMSDSTIKQPLVYVSKSVDYYLETFGNSGCIIRDTMHIHVPVHDFKALPKDTSICFGEVAPIEIHNGTYYQWYEYENGQYKDAHKSLSCDYCWNPTAKPLKSTHYKVKVGDEVFCYDTIDVYIEVRPLPIVNILNKDTIVKYGQSVQLLVNGARTYNWTPVSSINNPNISYPIATPHEPTMYVATGIATNGCRAFDTVRVGLDYRNNIFVPTAFSPNGDGKNDVFRVSNMTFQRFAEFRVFNRWGQEVYNGGGGSPEKGWDGTWKGVPQESGTYQYLIRVGYPDGLVETYKGDVTLVR